MSEKRQMDWLDKIVYGFAGGVLGLISAAAFVYLVNRALGL